MPAPFFIAAAYSAAVQSVVHGTVTGPISQALNPLVTMVGYLVNYLAPIHQPSPDSLVRAIFIDPDRRVTYADSLRIQGIDIGGPGESTTWRWMTDALRPHVPLQICGPLIANSVWEPSRITKELRRSGIIHPEGQMQWISTIGLPSVDWLLEQYRLQTIQQDVFINGMRAHGQTDRTWARELQRATEPFSVERTIDMERRGILSPNRSAAHLDANKLISPADRRAVIDSYEWGKLPSVPELLRLFRLGRIPLDRMQLYLTRSGYADTDALQLLQRSSASMSSAQALELLNRGLITEARATQHLESVGWIDDADRTALFGSRFLNPGVNQAIDWARRVQYLAADNDRWGIMQPLPDMVNDAAARNGWDQQTVAMPVGRRGVGFFTPAELSWYASWRTPSVGDVIAAWRHLTPQRAAQLTRNGFPVEPLRLEDVTNILLANGIPPQQHGYILGVATPNIPLVFLRSARKFGILDHAGLVEHILRLGHLREEAEIMATTWERQFALSPSLPANRARMRAITRWIAAVEKGYIEGVLGKAEAIQQLFQAGIAEEDATFQLTVAEAEFQHDRVKKSVAAIRKHYLHADYTAEQTLVQLARIGIQEPRRTQLVQTWLLDFTPAHKSATTVKVLQWLESGIISRADAERRLANLGWTLPDIVAYMAEAKQKSDKLRAAALAAADRAKAARVRLLQQIAKQQQSDARGVRSELSRLASPTRLQNWFKKGIIDDKQFIESMELLGYPEHIAHNWLREALDAQLAAKAKKNVQAINTASGSPSTNGESGTGGPATPG